MSTTERTLPERLRALFAAKHLHFSLPGTHVQAFAIVATEERLRDLLLAADQLEGKPAETPQA